MEAEMKSSKFWIVVMAAVLGLVTVWSSARVGATITRGTITTPIRTQS
jgi:hypothetical protein